MKKKRKAAVFCAAAAALAALSWISSSMKSSLMSQNMAQRWTADDDRYSQISVFMPPDEGGAEKAQEMTDYVSEKMRSEGYKSSDGSNVWLNAYSSPMQSSKVSVYDEYTGRTDECRASPWIIGVGGDFFDFHPLELISGNYIYTGELHSGRAVLDENAAWAIFSSNDVIGMKFTVNKKEFEVAGVVRTENSRAAKAAYPSDPVIFIHFDALEDAGMESTLTCYESVIPNPVSNYAKNIFLEYYGIDTMTEDSNSQLSEEQLDAVIVDNTARNSISNLFKNLKSFGKGSIVSKPIAYPYWENAARVNSAWLTLIFFIQLILSASIMVSMIVFVSKRYLNRKWHLKDFIGKLTDKYTYKKNLSDYISTENTNSSER